MAITRRTTMLDVVAAVTVTLTTVACIAPFLYVVSISLTDPDVYVPFQFRLFPQKVSLDIYRYILSMPAFLSALKSTIYIKSCKCRTNSLNPSGKINKCTIFFRISSCRKNYISQGRSFVKITCIDY